MKQMKLPREFKGDEGIGRKFRLTSLYLHQLNYDGKTIRRSVKRSQLAKYFQGDGSVILDGHYPGNSWEKSMWGIIQNAKRIRGTAGIYIGCVYFDPKSVRLLKRWALDGKTSRRRKQTS